MTKNQKPRTLVIRIDGGLGRVIAMTGAITEVAKTREVKVITSRPLAFRGNPYIKSVHGVEDRALWENIIKGNDYIELEPYLDSKFFNEGENWLNVAARILGLDNVPQPCIFMAEHEKLENILCEGCKPILFQPFGSSMKFNGADKSYRSLKVEDAQYVADGLTKAGYTVYVVEKDDQPKLIGCQQLTANNMRWLITLADRYPLIGIDSSMHHAVKAFEKSAVVIWAGTDAGRFGYETSFNLRNDKPYEYVPFRLGIDFNTDIINQHCNEFTKEELDLFIKAGTELAEAYYGEN